MALACVRPCAYIIWSWYYFPAYLELSWCDEGQLSSAFACKCFCLLCVYLVSSKFYFICNLKRDYSSSQNLEAMCFAFAFCSYRFGVFCRIVLNHVFPRFLSSFNPTTSSIREPTSTWSNLSLHSVQVQRKKFFAI